MILLDSSNSDFGLLVLGALLAVAGGVFGEVIKMFFVRRQEQRHIKISLKDELEELKDIVAKLQEFHKHSNTAQKSYVKEIQLCMQSYDTYRVRLHVFRRAKLRKEVVRLYKDVADHVSDSLSKAGTLSDEEASITQQNTIVVKFTALSVDAENLIANLDKLPWQPIKCKQ